MADMITRCPQCATAFRITAAHLKLAQGSVRCGACFTIFNALENLSERTTQNTPASNLADDFLISDHMGIEEESADTSNENINKSSLFERVEQAKAEPDKSEEADESWALALLSEEGLGELPANEDEFVEEEPSFRPFTLTSTPQPIELSDDFLKATKTSATRHESAVPLTQNPTQPAENEEASQRVAHQDTSPEEDLAAKLAQEHPELNADDLLDLQQALKISIAEPAPTSRSESAIYSQSASNNAHLIERIELDALEVTFQPRKGLSSQFWWGLGGLIAVMALMLQVAIIKMPQWRYDSALSPAYEIICAKFVCPQITRVDVSKIQTKSLLVREHPTHPGAFAIDAVIVNKAAFMQPFPRLILSFRNLQNQLINERIFTPSDYLGGEMAGEQNMPVKQEIRIGLEILDPGKDAVSYNLSAD